MATAVINQAEALAQQNELYVDPNMVHVDTAFNSRNKLDERKYKAMKEDVRKNGVQSAVKLFLSDGSEGLPEEGTPVLVYGFTRARIAKELYNETQDPKYLLPYTLIDHVPSRIEALTLNAAENFQRSDLTTWDEVMLIKRFEEEHGVKKPAELAAIFGKSPAWITQRRKLSTDLHPEIQKRLNLHPEDKGFVPGSVAMELVTVEDQAEQLSILQSAELAGAGVATRDTVKKEVSQAAESGKAQMKAKTMKQLHGFLESLTTPPQQMEDEAEEDFLLRREEYKQDPLVPAAKKWRAYLDGKTKETAFLKFLRATTVHASGKD